MVCQPQDDVRALFGGLSAEALKIKGVRGYIVDGGCRDLQAIIEQRFPVFARYATPIDIVSAWRAEAFGEPVAIGGHVVLQLLNAGHTVRTTVRAVKKEESVRAMLRSAGADPGRRLTFFAGDLASETTAVLRVGKRRYFLARF